MRSFGAVSLLALLLPAPALAAGQAWSTIANSPAGPTAPSGPTIRQQTHKIDRDIRDGRQSGQLTRSDARDLRKENGMIASLADRYAAGGLSDSERAELQTRTEVMRDQVVIRRSQGQH